MSLSQYLFFSHLPFHIWVLKGIFSPSSLHSFFLFEFFPFGVWRNASYGGDNSCRFPVDR